MDDDDVLDLTQHVLPWVSTQALIIGSQTLDNTYGKLGCDLFILAQQIPSIIDDRSVRATLVKVLGLLNKACSVGTVRKSDNDQFSTLRKIRLYNPETVDERIRSSLTYFVQTDPEFHVLQRLVQDCSMKANESIASPSDEKGPTETDEMEYPAYMNDILYEQLRLHACCNCNTGHLEWTQLRLGTENKQINADVMFELLFNPSSQSHLLLEIHRNNYTRWKEAIVLVSTRRDGNRKVAFTEQTSLSLQPLSNGIRTPPQLRHIGLGEFCKMINSQIHQRLYFHMQANTMKVIDKREEVESHRILPESGISLGDWLLKTPHLSNKGKVTLAYILVRSAWQYYDSLWMMTPWTHENICLLNEKTLTAERGRPHPYLRRQLIKIVEKGKDVYIAKDLMYRFPYILALGVLLVEIAIKQPFKEEQHGCFWSESTINDYYAWAWTTANRSNLKRSIHTIYEEVVNNCLNPDLFEASSLQESSEDSPKIRKRLLYEKVVSPLKRLYEAYQDNWEIQTVSVTFSSTIATTYNESIKKPQLTRSLSRDQFTVAILCALPLESDAVSSLFDEIWDENIEILRNAPNDSNAYTIGCMGRRMVVLVHMPGMGKSAASQSASSLRSTFPNINLALVVGICAGTPQYDGENNIFLGDVVISEGIVQYDFGRLLPGTFRRKESMPETLGRPNAAIRSLIAKMKTKETKESLTGKIVNYLKIIDNNLGSESAQYPGLSQDKLFQPNYAHKHYKPGFCANCNHFENSISLICDNASEFTCEQLGCQKDNLIARERQKIAAEMDKPPTPMVHIGLVGSADAVMKSGLDRDRIASRDKVLAFEMEGAGVWDVLPCIIIKGVSDYADSHKNKVWQRYAASTGAACMRAVLELWTH